MILITYHIKKILKKHFGNFVYFYGYLKNKILISIVLSISISVLDAFGLSMFLPLLQMVNSESQPNPDTMGNLSFLLTGIQSLGINLNLSFILLFMLLFFLFKGIATYASMVYSIILQQQFIKRMRLDLLKGLNQMSYKNFVTSNAGRIQNTMTGEVDRVASAYITYFEAVKQGVMVAVYASFAFFIDIQFAILVSLGGIITNLLYKYIYKHTKNASRKLTFSNTIYHGQIMQHVGNFKYLKATGSIIQHANRVKNTIYNIERSRRRIGKLGSIGTAAREPLLVIVVSCVILIQIEFLSGNLAPILISLLFFYRALNSLAFMQQQWNAFISMSGSLENMQNFQYELDQAKEKNGNHDMNSLRSSIRLKNINFSFGTKTILDNINLIIPKNQSIAFVGESGSGKTTLVNLIAGLLAKDNGDFLVDDISIDKLNKLSYQKRVGYVNQEPVIFNDSIFNNVTFWAEPTVENQKKFDHAIKQASMDDFLRTLKDGQETELGNNGINISGGQKQRISIARELFKEIDILIMDEATSALDSETESIIQNSIDKLKGRYTLLIVAHRLSSIREVDRIVFMNYGKIEEEGNFTSLIENYPKFKKMAELQRL